MSTQNTIVHKDLPNKEKLKINIQQIKILSGTINKLYIESMLKKLTHIYKK